MTSDDAPERGDDAVRLARAEFAEAGLMFPELPPGLRNQLVRRGPWFSSTSPVDVAPFDFMNFVRSRIIHGCPEFALIGHDGHGINSWALHYAVVNGPVALFVQRSWGGALDDGSEAASVNEGFARVGRLLNVAEGAGPPRIVVVDSDLHGAFWARLDTPVAHDDFWLLDWKSGDVWSAAEASLVGRAEA